MDGLQFGNAKLEDYDDIIDFIEFVFSQDKEPHNFLKMLPKLYKQEYFMDGIHYLVREDNRIKAVVGAFSINLEFAGGPSLPGRGIGMVSVHPRSRSKGYMKHLMNMALEDMKKDGIVFSCLSGQRQRYEYYGYTPVGNRYVFTVRNANIRHTLGRELNTKLSLQTVKTEDSSILDRIQAFHENKSIRYFRRRDKLFDILSTWGSKTYAIYDSDHFEGYLIGKRGTNDITEINMENPSLICEVIGLYLQTLNEKNPQDSIMVSIGPHETEKISVLSRFAEHCSQIPAYLFNVLNFKSFIEPFVKFRAKQRTLAEGAVNIKIKGALNACLQLAVRGGEAMVTETSSPPDLILDPLEAVKFFFAPLSAVTDPRIAESVFFQSLLPLPLFFENIEEV